MGKIHTELNSVSLWIVTFCSVFFNLKEQPVKFISLSVSCMASACYFPDKICRIFCTLYLYAGSGAVGSFLFTDNLLKYCRKNIPTVRNTKRLTRGIWQMDAPDVLQSNTETANITHWRCAVHILWGKTKPCTGRQKVFFGMNLWCRAFDLLFGVQNGERFLRSFFTEC